MESHNIRRIVIVVTASVFLFREYLSFSVSWQMAERKGRRCENLIGNQKFFSKIKKVVELNLSAFWII